MHNFGGGADGDRPFADRLQNCSGDVREPASMTRPARLYLNLVITLALILSTHAGYLFWQAGGFH